MWERQVQHIDENLLLSFQMKEKILLYLNNEIYIFADMMFLHATSSMERSDHGELLIGKKHVHHKSYSTCYLSHLTLHHNEIFNWHINQCFVVESVAMHIFK